MPHLQRLLLTVAALLTVSSCRSEAPKLPPPPNVQAAAARLVEFTEGIDTVSTLEASNLVELAAQSGGRIEQLKIRQGDEVEAGQLLLVLDQDEEKANADTAKANYERYAYLAEVGATSQKELDRYRTQYIEAKAKLSYSNLTSPSAGTVADVKVKAGDVIQQGQVFTSLVQNNELEAKVEVPAIFSARLQEGQPVLLMAPGSEEIIATGAVESIDPRINPNTQGLLVIAAFPNSDGTLRDGLRLHTRVQIKAEEQLAVPFAAVTQTSGQSFVFRLGSFDELRENPGKADLRRLELGIKAGKLPSNMQFALQTPVTVGELENNLYPITKGLKLNQKVATTNLLNLRHGMPVQVHPAKAN
ncbi:efflux RND transporter periplasmic adaptor subunit [Synechococcus sp. MU1642]|uniref:efflux RND transporter periplasmic adaptor subunit n=1 Tax=Synechococcus sp. MU1642 TaxID=2508348 RepID=UPI001CF900F1|nr:efflux RND transporter periplasmic adaptor subunit [Synechococcus sp. MU1642]